jgi:hypothetical protein
MARKCFYSFHYKPDAHRAAQIRNIGAIEGNKSVSDNDWETLSKGGDSAIKRWISDQMSGKSCTILLIGSDTANRPWINHEIIESWNAGMGIVGIYIHGIKNIAGETSTKGRNPFDYITYGANKKKLSSIVQSYDPKGSDSKEKYVWISQNLAYAVDEAIRIRNQS